VDAAQIALLRTKPAPGFVDVSTENVYRNTHWSPDRHTAIVRTFDAQTTNMHIAYSDGRAPRMIRRGMSQLSDWVNWSPDGSMIAFTQQTNMNGSWSLEVVRVDGKNLWHFDLPEGYNWYGWRSCSPIP
jgi:Tol biopolymer transport system component